MTFDLAKVPGGDVGLWGDECRGKALEALAQADWRGVYEWTKSWVSWGGGAWLPGAWLLYAASGLLHGQPKSAVHTLDLALSTWIEGPCDRAALTWCRGVLVWRDLGDPRTALLDLEAVHDNVPAWLDTDTGLRLERCRQAAGASRKRVPSVKPRTELAPPSAGRGFVAPAVGDHVDGTRPAVWDAVATHFEGP